MLAHNLVQPMSGFTGNTHRPKFFLQHLTEHRFVNDMNPFMLCKY